MPTRKIDELSDDTCKNPEHNPPMYQVFDEGYYEHECPECGRIQTFTVMKPIF